MKKTKSQKIDSISLFDDEVIQKAAIKSTDKKKSVKSVDNKAKEVKQKTKKVKDKVKHESKSSTANINKRVNTDKSVSSTSISLSEKPGKSVDKGKSKRAFDSKQKSKIVKGPDSNAAVVNSKTKSTSVKAGKSVKNSTKQHKESVKSSRSRSRVEQHEKRSTKSVATKFVANSEDEINLKDAKKLWRVKKRERTNIIPGAKRITGKPKSVSDDDSIVAIMVDGNYMEVSKWSVIDGIYYPGKDSNFLMYRLCYDLSKSTLKKKKV